MSENQTLTKSGETTALILRALVAKPIEKNVLSPDDVEALLLDTAGGFDIDGGKLTPEATRIIVKEDLAPLFLKPKSE
ncbi:hypothetical protein [Methylopila sp. M107]|uniref:hypothetical protein n=1 Tax=Methylopila sp. M107 TaxID=1101190 RepID=UPI00037A6DA8|nr:hypothetical protein [Methylopila sp. M107]